MSTNNNRVKNEKSKDVNFLRFTRIVNTSKLIQDKDLHGNSLVYEDKVVPEATALQTSILVKENKNSIPFRAIVKESYQNQVDVVSVYKKLMEFPIVETGCTSTVKDVVTVDVDCQMTAYDFWNAIRTVNLPNCLITQNKLSGHWQIQFYLNASFYVRDIKFYEKNGSKYPTIQVNSSNCYRYSILLSKLKTKFKALFSDVDSNYHGTMCRNPFNVNQKSYVIINKRIKTLQNSFVPRVGFIEMEKYVQDVTVRKNVKIFEPVVNVNDSENSRHALTLQYGREWVWNFIRNEKCIPSMNELSDYLHNKAQEIAELCGKEQHSWKEIESQVASIYEWSIKVYKDKYASSRQWKCSVEWNRNQKEAKLKKAKKIKSTFLSLRTAGYSLKEIAECLNMSRPTLYSYLLLFTVIDMVATAVKRNGMYIQRNWNEIIADIKSAVDEMKRCKIHWKEMDIYLESIENECNFVNYESLKLDGNEYNLSDFMAA